MKLKSRLQWAFLLLVIPIMEIFPSGFDLNDGPPAMICPGILASGANMNKGIFPDPQFREEESDMLPIYPLLTTENVLEAYSKGIFPWMNDSQGRGRWFFPNNRWVLFLNDFHVSERLKRYQRKYQYKITFNQAFSRVMNACSEREETWISDRFKQVWPQLFRMGNAISVEVWKDGRLAGGIYGTYVNGFLSADSAFSREPEAAKIAMIALVERLKANGHKFFDVQDESQWMKDFGARTIPKVEFYHLLKEEQAKNLKF